MNKKIFTVPALLFATGIAAQEADFSAATLKEMVFTYDEAGNQVTRKPSLLPGKDEKPKREEKQVTNFDEEFLMGVTVYPVPVKDVLIVEWTEENDNLIADVTLYEHNTMTFLFQRTNMANLNRRVQINMSGYRMGVYILKFTLKDGHTVSKNILKQ